MDDLSMQTMAAAVTPALGPQATGAVTPGQPDPAEARVFAGHMRGDDAATALPQGAARVTGVQDGLPAMLHSLAGSARGRPVEEIQRSMLAAIDPSDPAGTMVAVTNLSIEASATLSRLHLSTSLASAATSVFSTLLKNQQ